MPRKHGPWTINESERKYQHQLVEIYEDQVIKPDGTPGTYTTVRIKPGVSVLALDEEGFVYLAKEFRYAVGRESLEVVVGAIDEGERQPDAARRELKEELGIEASDLVTLGHVDPITSIIDSPSYLFLARQLRFTEPEQEGGESISRVKLRLEEAVEKVFDGGITHGSSCVLILRANRYVKGVKGEAEG